MASTKSTKKKSWDHPDREWEVSAAMHTMMRACEIIGDKKLLAAVKKHAQKHAAEMDEVAKKADQLAKMGRISPNAMARLGGR